MGGSIAQSSRRCLSCERGQGAPLNAATAGAADAAAYPVSFRRSRPDRAYDQPDATVTLMLPNQRLQREIRSPPSAPPASTASHPQHCRTSGPSSPRLQGHADPRGPCRMIDGGERMVRPFALQCLRQSPQRQVAKSWTLGSVTRPLPATPRLLRRRALQPVGEGPCRNFATFGATTACPGNSRSRDCVPRSSRWCSGSAS